MLVVFKCVWGWVQVYFEVVYCQLFDIYMGGYDDNQFVDEFVWVVVEFFVVMGDDVYWQIFCKFVFFVVMFGWVDVGGLGWIILV